MHTPHFSRFKSMAVDDSLSVHEKIGFPDRYREGKESCILADILQKLTGLNQKNKVLVDIGAGCGLLTLKLIDFCMKMNHELILIDSAEMLDQLPDKPFIKKIPACYPLECTEFIQAHQNKIDSVLAYSVMQYIFTDGNPYRFIDQTLSLLKSGGQFLIGDIPNSTKRKRFLNSEKGIQYHHQNFDIATTPDVRHFIIEHDQIDDTVVCGIIMRCRNAGFDAYIVPQEEMLPMANRREDILIVRP